MRGDVSPYPYLSVDGGSRPSQAASDRQRCGDVRPRHTYLDWAPAGRISPEPFLHNLSSELVFILPSFLLFSRRASRVFFGVLFISASRLRCYALRAISASTACSYLFFLPFLWWRPFALTVPELSGVVNLLVMVLTFARLSPSSRRMPKPLLWELLASSFLLPDYHSVLHIPLPVRYWI